MRASAGLWSVVIAALAGCGSSKSEHSPAANAPSASAAGSGSATAAGAAGSGPDLGAMRAAAKSLTALVHASHQVYAQHVVAKLKQDAVAFKAADTKHISEPGNIPLPDTFVHLTSQLVSASGNATVDMLSLWNIIPERGPRSAWELGALKQLAADPRQVVDEVENGTYKFAAPIVASTQLCVDCHNDPNPTSWRKSTKTDFKLHDVMGAIVIRMPVQDHNALTEIRLAAKWTHALHAVYTT